MSGALQLDFRFYFHLFNKDTMDKPGIGVKEADIKSRKSDIQKQISDKMYVYAVISIVHMQRILE